MSYDKAIKYGKEHRKPYHGSKAIDCSCRNGGDCEYCKGNRLYNQNREDERTKQELEEYQTEN